MLVLDSIVQIPSPGEKLCKFSGDTVRFQLRVPEDIQGDAYIRTNLGHSSIMRKEIIRSVEKKEVKFHLDWYDIKMKNIKRGVYEIVLPLCEVGHFEAKCYIMPQNKKGPIWPCGDNTHINVKPATSCAGNIIYNAFVRLFGPSKHSVSWIEKFDLTSLDRAGFHVIPPSGTFRDLIDELDFIIYDLGCRFIQLLPIFPVPTTFGRMGRFGSPYAVQDFLSVDPQLAQFDPKKTPIEQFMELASEIHKRGAYLILDMPINHTGWGSIIHDVHPEWLKRTEEGEIEVPEVWGVRWEDLTKLDYSNREVWEYMANVFLKWCDRGVDGFRGDAGYMIPFEVWEYIISKVRECFPDTIFFLEGLGGDINITRRLLNYSYDWAYSELFQNYTKDQIVSYVQFSSQVSDREGLMVHFCETHDNNRLASVSKKYAKMRTGLCALLSYCGAFGFACGVEWFADEKINVHEITSLNWGSPENQIKFIKRLSAILKSHNLFYTRSHIHFPELKGDNFIAAIRRGSRTSNYLIVLVNLDCDTENQAIFNLDFEPQKVYYDLITGKEIVPTLGGNLFKLSLEPAQVLCLSPIKEDLYVVDDVYLKKVVVPDVCIKQKAKENLYKFIKFFKGLKHIDFDESTELNLFLEDPYNYLKNHPASKNMVIKWTFPEDIKRMVMVPPGHVILFICNRPFKAKLKDRGRVIFCDSSIMDKKGNYFVLFCPEINIKEHKIVDLYISVFDDRVLEKKTQLIFLVDFLDAKVKTKFNRQEILKRSFTYLASNKRGSLSYVPVWWGTLDTKYNGLLSANLNPNYLDDRFVVFTRLRAWVVHQGYSEEINKDLIQRFSFDHENRARWDFYVPTGVGRHIHLSIFFYLAEDNNVVFLKFLRHPSTKDNEETDKIYLILRPDIESRSHHELTKAYLGPEQKFPSSVTPIKDNSISKGFLFHPLEEVKLSMHITKGEFVVEPEWKYMVYYPMEAERGLDPHGDLFSPGYFKVFLRSGEEVLLVASVNSKVEDYPLDVFHAEGKYSYVDGLKMALEKFLVNNLMDDGSFVSTVVAGFPWFLDWGRDSLIFARTFVEDNRFSDVISILRYFGTYEKDGTLPNLIKGNTPLNRDSSDAPLWFGVVLDDLVERCGMEVIEESTIDGSRTFEDIVFSIGCNYIKGTPNGIRVDEDTSLVFSPAHFTWMDTNHPACTPRQGYPVEIQALWYKFLCLLEKIDPEGKRCPMGIGWKGMIERLESSIIRFYFDRKRGYLSDCLHAESFVPAVYGRGDDHLRPNQLLCITLGLIKDREIMASILEATSSLLIPGGIRSIADRRFKFPLFSIPAHVIDDPYYPYKGIYVGDEDTSRKPAYHNGTGWTWIFPSYVEAMYLTYGKEALHTCLCLLSSSSVFLNSGCVGHIPEIMDGDIPHRQRGCYAQAWGVSELYRVIKKLLSLRE